MSRLTRSGLISWDRKCDIYWYQRPLYRLPAARMRLWPSYSLMVGLGVGLMISEASFWSVINLIPLSLIASLQGLNPRCWMSEWVTHVTDTLTLGHKSRPIELMNHHFIFHYDQLVSGWKGAKCWLRYERRKWVWHLQWWNQPQPSSLRNRERALFWKLDATPPEWNICSQKISISGSGFSLFTTGDVI